MPPAPQPQEVLKSLLSEAAKHPFGSRVSPFILNRWRNEAKKLTGKFPADAYHLLGVVAGFEGDEAEMREALANALKFSPDDFAIKSNLALWVFSFGHIDESIDFSLEVAYEAPKSMMFYDQYLQMLLCGGRFSKYAELACQGFDREEAIKIFEEDGLKVLLHVPHYCEKHGVRDEDAAFLLRIAFNLLIEKGVQLMGGKVSLETDPEEGDQWVSLKIYIDRPVPEIVELEDELDRRLAETEIPNGVDDHVLIGFLPGDGSP